MTTFRLLIESKNPHSTNVKPLLIETLILYLLTQ